MNSSAQNRPPTSEQSPLEDSAIHQLLNRPLSSEELNESTNRVSKPLVHDKMTSEGHLLFRLCHELFLFPSQSVDRVARVSPVRRIPHRSNQVVRGLCPLEGDLLICGDLTGLMQLSREDAENESLSRMVVLGNRDRWVVQVDQVVGVVNLDEQQAIPPPVTVRDAQQRFVDRLVSIDDELASVLDVTSIVSAFQAALS
ncbi:MAG: hypothetical protein GY768_31955 [Planctomycetaceae bacterium]|nr:hypothetical protein [Planctomycetaceae bacterium]